MTKKSEWVNEPKKRVTGEERHEQFQFPNPVKMSEFERSLVELEKVEREQAKRKYIQGIQGVDGGKLEKRLFDE